VTVFPLKNVPVVNPESVTVWPAVNSFDVFPPLFELLFAAVNVTVLPMIDHALIVSAVWVLVHHACVLSEALHGGRMSQ